MNQTFSDPWEEYLGILFSSGETGGSFLVCVLGVLALNVWRISTPVRVPPRWWDSSHHDRIVVEAEHLGIYSIGSAYGRKRKDIGWQQGPGTQPGWESTATTDHLLEAKSSKGWRTNGRATAELSLDTTKDRPVPMLPVRGRSCVAMGLPASGPGTALYTAPSWNTTEKHVWQNPIQTSLPRLCLCQVHLQLLKCSKNLTTLFHYLKAPGDKWVLCSPNHWPVEENLSEVWAGGGGCWWGSFAFFWCSKIYIK